MINKQSYKSADHGDDHQVADILYRRKFGLVPDRCFEPDQTDREKGDQRSQIEYPLNEYGHQSAARSDAFITHRQPHWPDDLARPPDYQDRRKSDCRGRKQVAKPGLRDRREQYLPSHRPQKIADADPPERKRQV